MTNNLDTRLPSAKQIALFERYCPSTVTMLAWYRKFGFKTAAGNRTDSFNMTEMRTAIAKITGTTLTNNQPQQITQTPATPPKLTDQEVAAMLVSMVDNYRVGLLTVEQVAAIVRRTN